MSTAVEYTADPDIDLGDLPAVVEAVWAEYVERHPRETRTLPEAIERVHLGDCWLGDQQEYRDAVGHTHHRAICLDRFLAEVKTTDHVKGRDDTVRHEMAHCIFGVVNHVDDRWPLALRLVGFEAEADVWQQRQDALFEGRIPLECPNGHLWESLEPAPDDGPLAYGCWGCGDYYDLEGEVDEDISPQLVNERKESVAPLRLVMLADSNWWSRLLPHPAAQTLTLHGTGRTVEVRCIQIGSRWWAAREGPDGLPVAGYAEDRDGAVRDLLERLGSGTDELLASLKEADSPIGGDADRR